MSWGSQGLNALALLEPAATILTGTRRIDELNQACVREFERRANGIARAFQPPGRPLVAGAEQVIRPRGLIELIDALLPCCRRQQGVPFISEETFSQKLTQVSDLSLAQAEAPNNAIREGTER